MLANLATWCTANSTICETASTEKPTLERKDQLGNVNTHKKKTYERHRQAIDTSKRIRSHITRVYRINENVYIPT